MKNRQLVSLSNIKKYKDKYVTVKDIYNSTKNCIRVKSERGTRMLEYSEYYSILEAYLVTSGSLIKIRKIKIQF
jgi:hypothetical protein